MQDQKLKSRTTHGFMYQSVNKIGLCFLLLGKSILCTIL